MTDSTGVEIAGLVVAWTGTVAGCLLWLNKQFSVMKDIINTRLSVDEYDRRHSVLEDRLRALELWAAKQNHKQTPPGYGK